MAFSNVYDTFSKDFIGISFLLRINCLNIKRNDDNETQPKSKHARYPILLPILEMQHLNAWLHISCFMREKLDDSLITAHAAQVV